MARDGERVALIGPGYRTAFALVVALFFAWALANSLNDVLIRHFRKALDLTRAEAGLIPSAFYFGYFVAALPAGWVMRRYGYRVGIVLGLVLYAAGALMFWPAAELRAFWVFLAALTVIALGLACLETAANPYVTVLGDARTAPARLNLAQAFNGVGAVVGPVIGGLFILSAVDVDADSAMSTAQRLAYQAREARAVQIPYVVLALCVVALAIMFARARLPEIVADADGSGGRLAAVLRRPRVRAAVAAQFAYVAAQVCIWSYFIDYVREQLPGVADDRAAFLLSSSIALLMLGRFAGAALLSRVSAGRALAVCAVANIGLCAIAVAFGGVAGVAAVWATSLFMSIMFPTIFALGLRDLGEATKTASALLIMAIVGGAIVPPLMGAVGDARSGLQGAFIVPLVCFIGVLMFGLRKDVR